MTEAAVRNVKSIVRVKFEEANVPLSYINDAFDLSVGDFVFVEGKYEGRRGRVIEVHRNFKIKPADYKRVTGKADTEVRGDLFMADAHLVAFDRSVIPYEKVLSWYKAPAGAEDEYVTGSDDTSFALKDFSGFHVKEEIFDRGLDYYKRNRVRYICVDGGAGRAIVEGSRPYEVEFRCADGQISGLVCDCFCNYSCKHEVAAMLQLRELLGHIEREYPDMYEDGGYFAAVDMAAFFLMTVGGKKKGCLRMGGEGD